MLMIVHAQAVIHNEIMTSISYNGIFLSSIKYWLYHPDMSTALGSVKMTAISVSIKDYAKWMMQIAAKRIAAHSLLKPGVT